MAQDSLPMPTRHRTRIKTQKVTDLNKDNPAKTLAPSGQTKDSLAQLAKGNKHFIKIMSL